jgi:iron(III) transport system ATP-binding protein
MSQIEITGLSKRFGGRSGVIAADNLNLTIEKGEFLVLLGPSGCGKTTTLRCLAGLETPDEGSISFAGQRVFDAAAGIDLAPDKRNIGMIFQFYALWPHMTVRQNIEYPLRARGLRQGLSEDWALATARLVECEALLERYPSQLSGGQQQRVAVARGLVARPDLVLFDEPLSNLDARLRDQVRSHIHELHSRLKFTAVFVTHDQAEALALGDRLAIMNRGRVEQLDTARRIFGGPASEYVANFIGMSNRFLFRSQDGQWSCSGRRASGISAPGQSIGTEFVARVREQDLHVLPGTPQAPTDAVALPATVIDVAYAGRYLDVAVAVGSDRFFGQCPSNLAAAPKTGEPATIFFRPDAAAFYRSDGGRVDLASR